jgi:protein-disulfide isomerase
MKGVEAALFLVVCITIGVLSISLLRTHQAQSAISVNSGPYFVVTQNVATIMGSNPDVKGQPACPYTLVEFADYQCPACGRAESGISELLARFPGKLNLVFRNYPLDNIHPEAMSAAIAAEAAREQKCFWPVHDSLFHHQKQLDEDIIRAIIMQYHLDYRRFKKSCMTSAKQRVKADVSLGASLWLEGTPTFILCCPDKKAILLSSLGQVPSLL